MASPCPIPLCLGALHGEIAHLIHIHGVAQRICAPYADIKQGFPTLGFTVGFEIVVIGLEKFVFVFDCVHLLNANLRNAHINNR